MKPTSFLHLCGCGKSKENSIFMWKKGAFPCITIHWHIFTSQGTIEKIQFHIVFTNFIAGTRIKQKTDIQYNKVFDLIHQKRINNDKGYTIHSSYYTNTTHVRTYKKRTKEKSIYWSFLTGVGGTTWGVVGWTDKGTAFLEITAALGLTYPALS